MALEGRQGVAGTLRRLSPAGNFSQPMIEPGGAYVAFWGVHGPAEIPQIWHSAVDGCATVKLTDAPGVSGHPSWFPDGRRIVFFQSESAHWQPARQFDVNRPAAHLWLIDTASGAKSQLTDGPFTDERPAVSPDGDEIIFVSNRSGSLNLWRIAVDGTGLRQVTGGSALDYRPVFSPDSSRIAYFHRGPDGSHQLAMIRWPDGQPEILPGPGGFQWVHGPFWSSDNRTILLHALDRGDQMPALWMFDSLSGNRERLFLPGVVNASHGTWDSRECWVAFDSYDSVDDQPVPASTSG